ncbi:WD40 repeat-like protein [Cubamyces sp. BRFM 1775]|nr:WD40 repeat-like protein [Cubamyces sp. BRFM 1775]
MAFALSTTIKVPSAVSALALGPGEQLCVGCDDGSVRWYSLPSTKVSRAIKSLGEEVSSIVWTQPKREEEPSVWIASGRKVFCFPGTSQKMIMSVEDASCSIEAGEDDDDLVNELNLSENGKSLAFGSDSGSVGVIETSSNKITRMRNSHTTVCGCVRFVPDRPSELLSGGYDSALLHFDVNQGSILSRLDIAAPPPTSQGVSLSPPFVLSVSINDAGLLAVSTADGRVWLGGGGEKRPATSQAGKKKRSRKWEGLKEDEGLWLQVADGPVVATAFRETGQLLTCSLLGALSEYQVTRDAQGSLQAAKVWSSNVSSIEKVNSMAIGQTWLTLGGFGKDGKGVVEVWRHSDQVPQPTS